MSIAAIARVVRPRRPVSFGAIRICQLDGGQVTGSWAYQDSLGLVQQLRA